MKKKIYYKVVRAPGRGRFFSARIYKDLFLCKGLQESLKLKHLPKIEYKIGEFVKAPNPIAGLCVFNTLKGAKRFIEDGERIFKAEVKNPRKPGKTCAFSLISDTLYAWPEGTIHTDAVKLLEEVSE